MNRAEFLFTLIDVFGNRIQNSVHIDGIERELDLSYGEHEMNTFDVYYRKSDRPKPVIVNFHGSGFVKGDKKYRRSICEILADGGAFVVNADYRLAPKYPFPACVCDAISAVNYLPKIADKYNLDLNKIVVCGDSSGGYLSSYVVAAYASSELRRRLSLPDFAIKISGFIGFCGVYDVEHMISMKEPFGFARVTGESYLGIKLKRNLFNLKEYEFYDIISVTDLVNSNWPPSLIIHGKKDLICPKQGDILLEKLRSCGVPCEEYHATKLLDNHCFHFLYRRAASKGALQAAKDFLCNVFNPPLDAQKSAE